MASRHALHQRIEAVFGSRAQAWLDAPNPQWQGMPRPRDLVECAECSEMVDEYLDGLAT